MAEIIFINYRRDDSEGPAGRLYDQLEFAFGGEGLFFDVDSILPGSDFADVLHARVGECTFSSQLSESNGWI